MTNPSLSLGGDLEISKDSDGYLVIERDDYDYSALLYVQPPDVQRLIAFLTTHFPQESK